MLVASIFSFSHNVFYLVKERNYHCNNVTLKFCHLQMLSIWSSPNFGRVISLPNNIFLGWLKLKAFADNKINVTQVLKFEIYFGKGRKHCVKRKQCWSPAVSPFPTMFSKVFLFWVIKLLNSLPHNPKFYQPSYRNPEKTLWD